MGPCLCGDPDCPSCGPAQELLWTQVLPPEEASALVDAAGENVTMTLTLGRFDWLIHILGMADSDRYHMAPVIRRTLLVQNGNRGRLERYEERVGESA